MKIYEYKGFPNPLRVRMALAEKGMLDKVEFVQIDVPKGEHKRAEYLAKNPAGLVPLLELDDGTCISECSAITEYFDHLDESPTLTGKGAKERAQIHMQQRRVEANLLDAVGTFFHHATPGLGKEIEGYQCAEWGEKQKERALKTIEDLNAQLEGQAFIAGDNFLDRISDERG